MFKFLPTLFFIFLLSISSNAYAIKISDIQIEGLQRLEPGLVFNNIPFEINDEIEAVDFSKTISLLYVA
jgi:outer membrane protein insertion porin family